MKIFLFILAALTSTNSYSKTEFRSSVTSVPIAIDAAKGSQLRGQIDILTEMVKSKRFPEAEEFAKQLRKSYEVEFNTRLKQYSFQTKAEYDEFKKTSSEQFEWIDWGYKECLQMQAFIKAEHRDSLEALEILSEIEIIAPISAQTLAEKGYVLNQMGKFNEALSSYQKAHDLSLKYTSQRPEQASSLRGMGFALIELGRLDEAEKVFKESLKLDPTNFIASNELKYIESLRNANQGRKTK